MSSDPNNSSSTMASNSSTTASNVEDQLKEAARSSGEDNLRLHEEANRLNLQVKRLRDEANEIEQRSKRLRTEADDADRLKKSLEFEALCLALRRNDASTTTLPDPVHFPTGYAQPLGKALEGNTHVASIDIWMPNAIPFLVDRFGQLSESETQKSVESFTQFLETSKSLRTVKILGTHTNRIWHQLFVGACFRNSKLQKLVIDNTAGIPVHVFQNCMLAKSLNSLEITLDELNYSARERLLVGETFRLLSALTNLNIASADTELLQAILTGLSNGDCKLQELKLESSSLRVSLQFWPAVSALLQCPEKVKHLSLKYFDISAQSMGELVRGLKSQDDAATTSLTTVSKLTLLECDVNRDASRLLRAFMHTRAESKTASSLEVLDIDCGDGEPLTAKDLLSMLSMRPKDDQQSEVAVVPEFYHTIGSRIKSLWVQPVNSIDGFLPRLAKHGHRICLEAFHVMVGNKSEVLALAKCMARVPSLRELQVITCKIGPRVCTRPIMRALKANGNIQSVSFHNEHDVANSKLAVAYCERNKLLDGLLMESTPASKDDGKTSQSTESGKEIQKKCPALLQAAQQIPTTMSSKLLRTLMNFRDSIG